MIHQIDDHILSPDTQTVLLLCGRFGKEREDANPLTNSEYNRIALWLQKQGMRPADLLDEAGQHLLEQDGYPTRIRLRSLLKRGTAMALAVESWANRGLWVLSRSDKRYPHRLRSRRKPAPPILYGVGDIGLLSDGGLAIVGSRDVDEEHWISAARSHVRVPNRGCRSFPEAPAALTPKRPCRLWRQAEVRPACFRVAWQRRQSTANTAPLFRMAGSYSSLRTTLEAVSTWATPCNATVTSMPSRITGWW